MVMSLGKIVDRSSNFDWLYDGKSETGFSGGGIYDQYDRLIGIHSGRYIITAQSINYGRFKGMTTELINYINEIELGLW